MQVAPEPPKASNSPGILVLQWLTYAFWGWTILAMCILTITVLAYFVTGADTSDFTPYSIASVLVLLPISIVCDFFYSKHEPEKKTGASSVIMIIHAVIFALFGIGSIIAIAFCLVNLFVSRSDSEAVRVALYSSFIITFLYAAVFLRTIRPAKLTWVRRTFTIVMIAVVALIILLGIIGPVVNARVLRNDKLIEGNLSSIATSINSYTRKSGELPDDLQSLNLDGDEKKLVDEHLVTYVQDSKPTSSTILKNLTTTTYALGSDSRQVYYYQLCATYKRADNSKNGQYEDDTSSYGDGDDYKTYPSISGHASGKVCYKLKTSEY